MESVKSFRGVVVLFIVVIACFSSSVISRSLEGQELHEELRPDAIDMCIFACDYCFNEHKMVVCANECIVTEGLMSPFWKRSCSIFRSGGETPFPVAQHI